MARDENPFELHLFTARNALLLVATAALYLGVMARNAELLAIGSGALAALVVAAWQAHRTIRDIEVTRTHHPRAFEEQGVPVHLRVRTKASAPANMLLLEDTFAPSSAYTLRSLLTETVRGGVTLDVRFHPTCDHRRGLYVLGPARLIAHDACGFFRREALLDLFTELLIYPNSVELNEADLLGDGILRQVGMEESFRLGAGEEFAGVREYRPGDPLRAVHWRSTARHRRPMVKEFQEPITTRVSIFLDLGRQGLVGLGDQTSVEYGIKAAAAIARRTVALGHELELFVVGEKVDHLPPGSGTAHLLALLDRLVLLKPLGESAFAVVVRDLAGALPRGGTAVLIAGGATVALDPWGDAIAALRARRILPIAVLVDDRAFVKLFKEQEFRHAKAPKLEETVRALTLRGAIVRSIRKAKSIPAALLQGLERDDAGI